MGIKKERPRLKVLDVQTTNYNPMNIYLKKRLLVLLFFSKKPDQSSQLKKNNLGRPLTANYNPMNIYLIRLLVKLFFSKNQISRPNLKKIIWDDP